MLDDVNKAVVAFTEVAHRAIDPASPLEQTLASAAGIAATVENGDGCRPPDRQRQDGQRGSKPPW
ncbi:MAG: hypothetical protein U1E60_09100 [Reyranellaceae bacterium]